MTSPLRKKIALILAIGILSFIQVMGITATQGEPPHVLCAKGVDCQPVVSFPIHTAYGSFDAWSMSADEFMYYKVGVIVVATIAQLALVFLLIRLLRPDAFQRRGGKGASPRS